MSLTTDVRAKPGPGAFGHRDDQAELDAYMQDGAARAMALGNRSPILYTADGAVDPAILESYWKHGFYIFENVLSADELADLEAGVQDIMTRLPMCKEAELDAQGRPAIGVANQAPTLFWSKPLGDPMGGTNEAGGRHHIKMIEATARADAPEDIVYLILGSLQFSDALLRCYGHPELLRVVEAINGPDFVPFTDALFIKEPGLGAAVSWHQDGITHWDSPDWDMGTHGFNLMGQLYGSTPKNGVWVVPGSHRQGKVDIKKAVSEAGTERLPNAVPIVCKPGDVAVTNRQTLHASFPNTSPDWRVTVNMGFHRRSSVLGVSGGGLHNAAAVYDEARIRSRSRVIGYAIDARSKRFPIETSYVYRPHAEAGERYVYDDAARASMFDYNLEDLSI
ncbi:MAG: phytanoyl-CoA dioxygenase family protein [Pseudomonadota bacterium]